jgi:hypothetical protein
VIITVFLGDNSGGSYMYIFGFHNVHILLSKNYKEEKMQLPPITWSLISRNLKFTDVANAQNLLILLHISPLPLHSKDGQSPL